MTCLPFHGIHGQTCTGLHWNPVHEALRISSILGSLALCGRPKSSPRVRFRFLCRFVRIGLEYTVYMYVRTAAIDPTVRLASSRRRSHHQPCRATSRYSLRS